MAEAQVKNNSGKKGSAAMRLVMLGLILVCLNFLTSYFHKGLDLTREKRFTLSDSTVNLLKNMKEVASITVYMKGKFPADMQRMQEAVREELASFKDIAGKKLIYTFVDPFEGKAENEQKQIALELHQKGIEIMPLPTQEEEGYSMKVCFPYALLQYNGREMPITLLESPPGKDRTQQIVYASALLEYKFASAINELSRAESPHVAYLTGHGEDVGQHSIDMLQSILAYYNFDTLNLKNNGHISNAYQLIIINNPTTPFTDPEKLRIDQFVMRGGHVLWVVNSLNASMDSLNNGAAKFMATERGLNLDDILFKYGVRVNNDLVQDQSCLEIPILNRYGQMEKRDWIYFPKINPTGEHPIVKNMDFVKGEFTNSIDTILASGIKKTVLLTTSKYSRTSSSPVTINLNQAVFPGTNEYFNKPYRNVAVLLEGKFQSVYKGKLAPSYLAHLDSINEPFKPQCEKSTSIIVTSIGDVFKNDFTQKDGPLRLGYYKYSGELFANKDFLMNCIEYLTDKSGILESRNKDAKLRLLDKGRTKDEKDMWQAINIGIPIALILMFASAYMFFRKKKYEVKMNQNPA